MSFRNLADAALEWGEGLNVISGDNGQGKTNLLEAVHVLAMGRSFRTSRRQVLARRGAGGFALGGLVEAAGVRHDLDVESGPGRSQRRLDGKAADLGETLPVLFCLAFASARLDLFRGGPEERRRFLDRGAVGLEPGLLPSYRDHARALRHKNELLRRARETGGTARGSRAQISAFNERLAAAGSRIQRARSAYMQSLQAVMAVPDGPASLVPGGPPALEYRPSPRAGGHGGEPPGESGPEALLEALEARMDEEIRRGQALAGPQRDDLALRQNGLDLARFGSSGQQRAALIALKIAKMQVHHARRGAYPVLLVDDVDSELDAERTRRAVELLAGPFQVLVASARGHRWAKKTPSARHFQVRNGIIAGFN